MLMLTGLLGLVMAGSMMDLTFMQRSQEEEEAEAEPAPEGGGDDDDEGPGNLWEDWDDAAPAGDEAGREEDGPAAGAEAAGPGISEPGLDMSGTGADDIIGGGAGADTLQGLEGDDQIERRRGR